MSGPFIPSLLSVSEECLAALDRMIASVSRSIAERVTRDGKADPRILENEQYSIHAFAWMATYVEALHRLREWAVGLDARGEFTEIEALLYQIGFGEYVTQITTGIMMSQCEIGRLSEIGIETDEMTRLHSDPAVRHSQSGNTDAARKRLVEIITRHEGYVTHGNSGLDEEMDLIRDNFFQFSNSRIRPSANRWHRDNDLIPIELIEELAELGVFGLTVPEKYDGMGMSKIGMCVVSEELSRGYLGVGSLATRCEIAAELIGNGGTTKQKEHWLPRIASGDVLPTAVFTEPGSGSDLGSLKTRAINEGDHYRINGNKTWITHASRANMMTLLARTDPDSNDHRGLSMFIISKQSGSDDNPFPDSGLSGTEIEVLGYRGMREYELAFDGFRAPIGSLLGKSEGNGFKQLMATFESARIQTAARAIGVAQSALDAGLEYANQRVQFGKKIVEFPRIYAKLAVMAAEIILARQLTYHAARLKDNGRRCDLEAGMAKLLAARIAWSASDNAVQIHGGNGFALEYDISRILCDARILSIFEGAAEIQATVISRRIIESDYFQME